MAIGDSYNYDNNGNTDNNKKEFRDQEYYSDYNTSNDAGVEPTALSYSFWKSCLKISIAPMLENPSSKRKWDHKNAAVAFLNHNSARMFKKEVEKVLNGELENGGVKIGMKDVVTLLTFSNGKDVGAGGYCLVIRSVDGNGTILATYIYEFKRTNYAIENFKPDTSQFDRSEHDIVEVEELLDLLEQYYLAMTNSMAYSVMNQAKYDVNRFNTKIGLVAEALGVKFTGGSSQNSGGGGSNSYFDNQGEGKEKERKGVRQTTLEGIGGTMNEPED